jgi:hypothetical protein
MCTNTGHHFFGVRDPGAAFVMTEKLPKLTLCDIRDVR